MGRDNTDMFSYVLVLLRSLSYFESLGVDNIPLSESRCREVPVFRPTVGGCSYI